MSPNASLTVPVHAHTLEKPSPWHPFTKQMVPSLTQA